MAQMLIYGPVEHRYPCCHSYCLHALIYIHCGNHRYQIVQISNMSSTLFLIPTKISKQVDNISKNISNNYHIDHKYRFDKRNSNNYNNYLFLYISLVLNPVNTPIAPHSKALFSLETYKFFFKSSSYRTQCSISSFFQK